MIRSATPADLDAATRLAHALWPEHDPGALRGELADALADENALLALCVEQNAAVGFAHCALRFEYVEGAESSPVGYLEGIFVEEAYRLRGVARALLSFCEQWAREKGCRVFASDCELDNEASLRFHLRAGFAEAGRLICFVKGL